MQDQIYACEGFRVRLTVLSDKTKRLPPYEFPAMAPQRWRISDWKTARMAAYVALLKDAVVMRGDGSPARRDLQLGNLRDTYYAEHYGSLEPSADATAPR